MSASTPTRARRAAIIVGALVGVALLVSLIPIYSDGCVSIKNIMSKAVRFPVAVFSGSDAPYNSTLSPPDLGAEWFEEEGGWRGVWRRREDSNIFDASMNHPYVNYPVTFSATVHRFQNNVYIIRQNSSDGNDCGYAGVILDDGNGVFGTFRCNDGGGDWAATIVKRTLLGRLWQEQEGGWTGIWTRRGDSKIFDARWTAPGLPDVTAVLTVYEYMDGESKKSVQVERRQSSDGNDCNYVGSVGEDDRTVAGNFWCINGGGSWSTTVYF